MSLLAKTRSAFATAARTAGSVWRGAAAVASLPQQRHGCGSRFHGSGCSCGDHSGLAAPTPSAAPSNNGITERFYSVMPGLRPSPVAAPAPLAAAAGLDSSRGMTTDASNRDIADLLENNRNWVAEMKEHDPDFFVKLGGEHKPRYLYIGCSDARVPANEIIGQPAGEVFVHRNVGNQVVGTDLNVLSVIDYAVDHLGVKHIIVTGHYDCGAVKASVENRDIGLVENWLRSIRDVYRLHFRQLDAIEDGKERHRRLVELNVVEQCLNLYKNGTVQRKRQATFRETGSAYPRIHGLVFDPSEGILHKLPVKFGEEIKDMRHVYDLYDVQKR